MPYGGNDLPGPGELTALKPKCGSEGRPEVKYDLPLHVVGLCEYFHGLHNHSGQELTF
jgi:hypothetical protein